MIRGFVPSTAKEMSGLGWKGPDVVIVTGDAYIDHPFFPAASAGRFLNSGGIRTAILDMPDPEKEADWTVFGRPFLCFVVIAGKEDSMAMNYTAFRKYRSTDPYIPGGKRTVRPDRAVIKYCNVIRKLFKDVPIILSGAEAAGRMSTHYDYWTDTIRKPLLFDSKADMIVYSNIEHNLLELCGQLKSRRDLKTIIKMNGTAYISKEYKASKNTVLLPSHEDIVSDKRLIGTHHNLIHLNMNPYNSKILVQKVMDRYMVIHRPGDPLSVKMTDDVFGTGFKRRPHPKYKDEIPIYRFIKDMIITHRGCLNDISCSQDILTEGRMICSRSQHSVRKEVTSFVRSKEYNKTLRVFGLPRFNHYGVYVSKTAVCAKCTRLSCTMPDICPNISKDEGQSKLFSAFDETTNLRNIYTASEADIRLLLSDMSSCKDLLTKRNDGVINLDAYKNDLENTLRDIRFLRKKAGEYGKKNLKFKISITAGYPGVNDIDTDLIVKTMEDTGAEIGDVRHFVPLPMTIESAIFCNLKDKKLSGMRKLAALLKKIRGDSKKKKGRKNSP